MLGYKSSHLEEGYWDVKLSCMQCCADEIGQHIARTNMKH